MIADSLLGNSQKLDGGAMFGNVPRAMWQKWLTPDAENRVQLACRCLLVRDLNGKTVLFETGIGAFFEPKMRERFGVLEPNHVLLDSLAELGLNHTDIDVVVLSHLHFDHAGGLLAAWQADAAPQLLFPKATFVVSRACWERAKHPHARDRASFIAELPALLEQSERLEIVDGEQAQALGPKVRLHYSDGHTPGLMLAEIIGSQRSILFCADLIPGAPWVHLPVTMGYDRNAELLIDEKRALLTALHARHTQLFFTHDPNFALANIQFDGGRFTAVEGMRELRDYRLN